MTKFQQGQQAYTQSTGIVGTNTNHFDNRAPTNLDIQYKEGTIWIDQTLNTVYLLTSFSSSLGQLFANWILIGTGSGDLQNLTPDVGGTVFPTAGGTINVTGYPVGTSALKGIRTFNGNVDSPVEPNTVSYQNLRDLSRYVVGPNVNESQFTSIQTAINTAVADGFNTANPAIVYVTAGTYTEDLTLQAGIALAGVGLNPESMVVLIQGAAVLNPSPGTNTFTATGITFSTALAASPAFSIQGANPITVFLANCAFVGNTGTAYENINANASTSHTNCFYISGAGQKCWNLAGGEEIIYGARSTFTDTKSTIVGNKCSIIDSLLEDSYLVQGANPLFFNDLIVSHTFPATNFEAINLDATASVGMIDCFLDTSSPTGFSITGTGAPGPQGSLGYNAVTPAQQFDPALNIQGFGLLVGTLSFDGGSTAIGTLNEIIIGNNVNSPQISQLIAGPGITIVTTDSIKGAPGTPGTTTISSTGGGTTWVDQAGAFLSASNFGYFITAAAVATLPAAPVQGDVVQFIDISGGGIVVTANAGQTIQINNVASSVAGTATNSAKGDCLSLVYQASSTTWFAKHLIGIWSLL